MAEDKSSKVAPESETTNVKLDVNMEQNPDEDESGGKKKPWLVIVSEILVYVLGAVTIVFCLVEIIVTILAAVANKIYDAEQSGHMVTMVVLAITSAITLSIVIYCFVGLCKRHTRPLHTSAVVLFIVALIQALLTGLVVNVREADHHLIDKALVESFALSREGNPRHIALWSSTQHDLECCGLNGPDDYRRGPINQIFPPNVPISCCENYDDSKSDSSQERNREYCKANRQFYESGCRQPVIQLFKATAHTVVVCTSILIVFEVLVGIFSAISGKSRKRLKNNRPEEKDATPQNS